MFIETLPILRFDIKSVYLAGPMRGYPMYNFPAFDNATIALEELGYVVHSPAKIDRSCGFDPVKTPDITFPEQELPNVIRRDIDAILKSDAIVLLPGWEESIGATAEVAVGEWANLPAFALHDFFYQHYILETQAPDYV